MSKQSTTGSPGDPGSSGEPSGRGGKGGRGGRGGKGARGARGATGRIASRKVTLSFVAVVASSVVALGVMGFAIKGNHDQGVKLRESTARTTLALCELRKDLVRRRDDDRAALATSRQFLSDHPDGIPGIPVKLLKDNITAKETTVINEQASIEALSIVKCER